MRPPPSKRFFLAADSSEYRGYIDALTNEQIQVLGPLSAINILVGANNSGKSRLLRQLFKATSYDTLHEHYGKTLKKISKFLEQLISNCGTSPFLLSNDRGQSQKVFISQIKEFHKAAISMSPKFWRTFCSALMDGRAGYPDGSAIIQNLFAIARLPNTKFTLDNGTPLSIDGESLIAAFHELSGYTADEKRTAEKRVYIPTHRTAVSLFGEGGTRHRQDILLSTVSKNYSISRDSKRDIFTGLDLYSRVLGASNGEPADRKAFKSFLTFLSETFFSKLTVEMTAHVPKSGKDEDQHVMLLVGDKPERELHNFGDGITALIVLLYPFFTAEPNTWIMVEEPEIFLHPGFQRIFLETLLNHSDIKAKNLLVFFTTHSNHLLGIASEHSKQVSIINLSPQPGVSTESFIVRPLQGASMHLLDELGVGNGSVFLANCAIWVEGPSDRLLITTYLDAYFQFHEIRFAEDIDYAFFMYGGSLIEHYLFPGEADLEGDAPTNEQDEKIRANFMANRVFLLCDNDDDPKKHRRHRALHALSNVHFGFATTEPAIEIENTVSIELLQEIIPKLHPRKSAGADLSGLNHISDWQTIRLGKLCEQIGVHFAHEPSGTLKSADKLAFANLVKDASPDWNKIGPTAQNLVKKIAKFIKSHSATNKALHND